MTKAPAHEVVARSPASVLGHRTWLLTLLDGVEHAGATPIDNSRLHRLAFLANCLSPVYDLPVPDGKIMKYNRGPFYPNLQWDIDRLVGCGFIALSDLRHFKDEFGPWFSCQYSLSRRGIAAIQEIIEAPQACRIHSYLREVAAAYASLPEESRSRVALEDATYGDPAVDTWSIIDFAEWDDKNYSERVAQAFDRFVVPGVTVSARDRLHLYFKYLNRMVDRAAG